FHFVRGMMTAFRSVPLAVAVAFVFPALVSAADRPVDYLRDVRPVLAKNCYQCHGAKAQKGGLRVDTVASLKTGGDTGPAFVPGKSGDSLLIQAVIGAEGVTKMPLKKPELPAGQVALLKAWIDAGAPAPDKDVADDGKQCQAHWSLVPPA